MWHLPEVTPPDPAAKSSPPSATSPSPLHRKTTHHHHDTPTASDKSQYQTIYAKPSGTSVAAPTAGLHFTPQLLAALESKGIQRTSVDLEVGLGTFLPVETDTLEEHPMHTETFAIPTDTITALRHQRQNHHRIIVVGTTAVRTLESAAPDILNPNENPPTEIRRPTDLKISPGFTFQLTDALITNFHLPKSTLMALVAAFLEPHGLQNSNTSTPSPSPKTTASTPTATPCSSSPDPISDLPLPVHQSSHKPRPNGLQVQIAGGRAPATTPGPHNPPQPRGTLKGSNIFRARALPLEKTDPPSPNSNSPNVMPISRRGRAPATSRRRRRYPQPQSAASAGYPPSYFGIRLVGCAAPRRTTSPNRIADLDP